MTTPEKPLPRFTWLDEFMVWFAMACIMCAAWAGYESNRTRNAALEPQRQACKAAGHIWLEDPQGCYAPIIVSPK